MVKVPVEQGDIARIAAKAVIVNLFEGVAQPGGATGAVDAALDGAITKLIAEGDIKGKDNEITVVHTFGKLPAGRVVVAGLGKSESFTLDKVRDITANVCRHLRRLGVTEAATVTHGAGIGDLEPEACAQAVAEGAALGLYRFTRHKSKDDGTATFATLTIVEQDAGKVAALGRGVERGLIMAEAANFARDLANEPSNVLTPTVLADRAREAAAAAGVTCEVFEKDWMVGKGMGSLLGVAQGSHQPPKLIVLTYRGNPGSSRALGLIGKGITFDTGGISIKPAQGMEEMKGDMSGAAAVIAAVIAIARLGAKVNVTAIAPATENMPGGGAIKPGDVLRAMNGKTIEVLNTDAEGRLILADGLSFARELQLDPLVDVATLTGAISVALGNVAMGVMTNDDAFAARIQQAAARAGEKAWQLPMYDEYREQIRSDVADIKNTGGRPAGSITAAWFLREFVDGATWAHIDMAGVDNYEREKGVLVKGASGIPVRTLVNLALSYEQ